VRITVGIPEADEGSEERCEDLSILKKLEKTLRGADGLKTFYISFDIALRFVDSTNGADLHVIETAGFTLDRLVVDILCDDWESHGKRTEGLQALVQAEV
jgi:hypothetical protein